MIVGAIRSAYETETHFYHDSDATARVLWYFVPEDSPNLPYPSVFCDTVWHERNCELQQPVGESQTGHVYSKGFPPATYPTPGATPCGTPDQWLHGASINDPFPSLYPGTTVPTCCPDAIQLFSPGGASQGARVFPPPCLGACDQIALVYLQFRNIFPSCPPITGVTIPMFAVTQQCFLFGEDWRYIWDSGPVNIVGVDYYFSWLCRVAFPQMAMFYRRTVNKCSIISDKFATTTQCNPVLIDSGVAPQSFDFGSFGFINAQWKIFE